MGRLDWIGAVYLREAVCGSLRRGLELTIDLEMTDFVDMDGLDAIMDAATSVHEVGGSAVIINAPPDVEHLLRIRDIVHHLDRNGPRDPQHGANLTSSVSRHTTEWIGGGCVPKKRIEVRRLSASRRAGPSDRLWPARYLVAGGGLESPTSGP
jgi:anti-anti-sigma regulatory factor